MLVSFHKKILFSTLILAICLTGCQKEEPALPNPVACFTLDLPQGTKEGDEIFFIDCSENATLHHWNFGDGTSSFESEPSHTYTSEGVYTITLIVQNQSGSDTVSQSLEIASLYKNFIKIEETKFPLDKASSLTSICLDKLRYCILLADAEMEISSDSLIGIGKGVKLIFDYNPQGNSKVKNNSQVYLGANTEPLIIDDELVSYTFNGSWLELDISTDNINIHYKGNVSTGGFYYYPSIDELETYIRKTQDHRATFSYDEYRRLLAELSKDRYIVLPLNEMIHHYDDTKIVVGMRHDVDCHPFKALEMAKIEKSYGLRSTYYILATAPYYGILNQEGVFRFPSINQIYKEIYGMGCEIGIHNDLIAVMVYFGLDPLTFNHNELAFYKSINIPVNGTASHGSYIASVTATNFKMFSDFTDVYSFTYNGITYPLGQHSLAEYGFDYEAYFIGHNRYFSESGGVWSAKGGLNEVISSLQNMAPGIRVQILTHPVWWGK